jgi:hypothetical protein
MKLTKPEIELSEWDQLTCGGILLPFSMSRRLLERYDISYMFYVPQLTLLSKAVHIYPLSLLGPVLAYSLIIPCVKMDR